MTTVINDAGRDLKLIRERSDHVAMEAGRTRPPRRGDQAFRQFRTIDAVKQRRLVHEVGIPEGDEVDAWHAPVEVLIHRQIDVGLLDFNGAT